MSPLDTVKKYLTKVVTFILKASNYIKTTESRGQKSQNILLSIKISKYLFLIIITDNISRYLDDESVLILLVFSSLGCYSVIFRIFRHCWQYNQ